MSKLQSPFNPENQDKAVDSTLPVFGTPEDVLRHPGLGVAEKRSVLAAWASDAHSVPYAPSLRQLDDGSIISVHEILRALKSLDEFDKHGRSGDGWRATVWRAPFERRRSAGVRRWPWLVRRRRDDDDDPPPCPAYAAKPPKAGGGAAALEPALA